MRTVPHHLQAQAGRCNCSSEDEGCEGLFVHSTWPARHSEPVGRGMGGHVAAPMLHFSDRCCRWRLNTPAPSSRRTYAGAPIIRCRKPLLLVLYFIATAKLCTQMYKSNATVMESCCQGRAGSGQPASAADRLAQCSTVKQPVQGKAQWAKICQQHWELHASKGGSAGMHSSWGEGASHGDACWQPHAATQPWLSTAKCGFPCRQLVSFPRRA